MSSPPAGQPGTQPNQLTGPPVRAAGGRIKAARSRPGVSGPVSLPTGPVPPDNCRIWLAPGSPGLRGAVAAMTEPRRAVTLCEAFQHTVARHPRQLGLRPLGGAATITWQQYASRVRQIAAGLAGLGVSRGDTVAGRCRLVPTDYRVLERMPTGCPSGRVAPCAAVPCLARRMTESEQRRSRRHAKAARA